MPVEVRASRISYAGQAAVLLHVRDITDRKLAEAALRSSEMLFHSVWENSVDGMRLTDGNGTIVAVNEAFCKLVGTAPGRAGGQTFHGHLCGRPGSRPAAGGIPPAFRERASSRSQAS